MHGFVKYSVVNFYLGDQMKQVEVEIEGVTPLLQHRMNEETLMGLLAPKARKTKVVEELTPRQIAEKAVYRDDKGCFIPAEYVVGAFKFAASDFKENNKTRRSMKTIAAAIFRPNEGVIRLLDEEGKQLKDFEVDIKKATNHAAKGAVAVCRPRFDRWKCRFTVSIDDSMIAPALAQQIFEESGKRVGIGSFRVAKGGVFGQFRVTKWKET